jgi:hypothetical protein
MKIRPVGAELFYADRQKNTTKIIVALHNFANAPLNGLYSNVKELWTELNWI